MKNVIALLFVLALTGVPASAQSPKEKPKKAEAVKFDPKLTDAEYSKLRIAELEITNAGQEMALLNARFKELQNDFSRLRQVYQQLTADVLKVHGAEGGQINMTNKEVIPPPKNSEEKK